MGEGGGPAATERARLFFLLENTYSVSVHYRMRDHITAENVRFARDFETDRSKEG